MKGNRGEVRQGPVVLSCAMTDSTMIGALCVELQIGWTSSDASRLDAELAPYYALLRAHAATREPIPSHIPGTGSICVPITDVTEPYELYQDAAGTVRSESFTVAEYDDYWLTTHVSTVPVVILLAKHRYSPFRALEDLCERCARHIGERVGGNCYLQWNLPGFAWQLHTDDDYEGVSSRVHVPLVTTPQNVFAWAPHLDTPRGQWLLERHLERGHVYLARTDVPHTAINEHPFEARLHLIIDVGS